MDNNLIILSSKEKGGGGIATTIATISIVNRDLKIVVKKPLIFKQGT